MNQVLVVEDSSMFGPLLCKQLQQRAKLPSRWVRSYKECEQALAEEGNDTFVAAVLDLNLPDAPEGEVVDLVIGKGIPSVVFTGELSQDLRRVMWSKHIVDYLYKDRRHSVDYLVQTIRRLVRNIGLKVLVVDDSLSVRNFVGGLLKAHGYEVVTASDGDEALEVYKSDPDIRLVVMDYNMPHMNGAETALAMRSVDGRRRRDDLALIGMSAQNDPYTSIEFLKSGANDFIIKPFQIEEFYCRVSQNVDMLNLFHDIRDMGNRDFLTGLYNRKMLFGSADKLFAQQKEGKAQLIASIMDIDFFKKVNDTYGHDGGDAVLKHFAQTLKDHFESDCVVARFGGEEFCVLMNNIAPEAARERFEAFRKAIEASVIETPEHNIKVTVSIGVSTGVFEHFEEHLKAADELLYKAKESGRNQVQMV